MVRALDRYVFIEFWKIFVTTALGFPILLIIIDLTDNLDKYLTQRLGPGRIALSYLYWLPDSMFMVLPAAVLFATVFAIGAMTRHSEITAAKASGISFYRFIAPIFVGAVFATTLGLILGELAPITNKKRLEILQANRVTAGLDRYNFAYAADRGRIYKIGALHLNDAAIDGMVIERKGNGPDYPSYVISANTAKFVLGVASDSPGSTPLGSVDGDPKHVAFTHTFSTLTFDGVTVTNPHFAVTPDLIGDKDPNNSSRTDTRTRRIDDYISVDLTVGMEVLRKLHLYAAFGERNLYITPASAPVPAPATATPPASAIPAQ